VLKSFARGIDRFLFRGNFRRAYGTYRNKASSRERMSQMRSVLTHSVTTHHKRLSENLLTSLCDYYGSDKGSNKTADYRWTWKPHSYTEFYHRLFSHFRHDVRLVFECGLGTPNPEFANNMGPQGKAGASLRVWRDYFPQAVIYGADIDSSVLFDEPRIRTYWVDQTSPSAIKSMWTAIQQTEFDFVVDDGLHAFRAGSCLFEHSIEHVRQGGVYVIEDVASADWDAYLSFFDRLNFDADLVRFSTPDGRDEDTSLFFVRK
jgi:hypothetical protein